MTRLSSQNLAEKEPTILIVEDHPLIADVVETRLRMEDMKPIKCLRGEEAIAALAETNVDLVILDIIMPDIDGYELFHYLKSREKTRNIPVIFLTARTTANDIRRGLEMGADCYITKPFRGADLVRTIRVLLREKSHGPASIPPSPSPPPVWGH